MSKGVACKIIRCSEVERVCYQCNTIVPIGSRVTDYVQLSTYEQISVCDNCKKTVGKLINFLIAR